MQQHTTNSSIRQRFSILERNAATATRLIAEPVNDGAIAPYDQNAGRQFMRYVPYWAETAS